LLINMAWKYFLPTTLFMVLYTAVVLFLGNSLKKILIL
jgi:NADH:ubiquinone oxidoreductase subunit H